MYGSLQLGIKPERSAPQVECLEKNSESLTGIKPSDYPLGILCSPG